MARRQMNGLFLMTPYALLRMPEYGRFFDGSSIGYLYRLILTGVRRQEPEELKFINETGWVTKLATLYKQGKLASYFSLDDLVESTGFTRRRIYDLIKKLEDIKLVKTEGFNSGFVFIVGIRLSQNSLDGYSVGKEHEGLFIDEWESKARSNPKELASFLIENLAPPKQKDLFLGKIFHSTEKNISQEEEEEIDDLFLTEQDFLSLEETPSVDKVSVDNTKAEKLSFSTEDLFDFVKPEADYSEVSEAKARIKSEPNWIEKFKAARKALSVGVPLQEVNSLLAMGLPEEFSLFKQYPRLGYRLYSLKHSDKEARRRDYIKLGNLWSALHEDITGIDISEASDKFKEIRGFYKANVLSKYSFNQIFWTLKTAVFNNTNNIQFLSSGYRNLLTLVEQNAYKYNAAQESKADQDINDKIQEERLKRLNDIKNMEVDTSKITNPWARLFLEKEKNE